jgi:hypothetical protein
MRFSRGRLCSAAGAVLAATYVAVATVLVQAPAAAAETPAFYTFGGVEICEPVVSSWGGTRYGDVPIGSFAPDGSVIGGEAVIALYLDLGTAPLAALTLPPSTDSETGLAIKVDPSRPRASGTLNVGAGSTWNGFSIQPAFFPATDGPTSGAARFGIALITHRDQPLREALGVAVDVNVTRGRCLGAVGAITEHPLTVGGAAEFAAGPTLQPTVYGQPINDGPGAIESVSGQAGSCRLRRRSSAQPTRSPCQTRTASRWRPAARSPWMSPPNWAPSVP